MNRTRIDWPGHPQTGAFFTLNPVVGCIRGCEYCYAKEAHTKRYEALKRGKKMPDCYKYPFHEIKFYPERLKELQTRRKPARIFLNSVSDPKYWKPEWMCQILFIIGCNHNIECMILSKNTSSYYEYDFPENCMCGLTITGLNNGKDFTELVLHKQKHRPFLSIEPLLGKIPKMDYDSFELVIVGAMTGKGAIKPQKQWIESVRDNVPESKLYWKESIRKFL